MKGLLILLIVLAVLALLFGYGRARGRHGESGGPGADWKATTEVFVDPSTGRRMRVWIDAAGNRRYLAERPPAPPR